MRRRALLGSLVGLGAIGSPGPTVEERSLTSVYVSTWDSLLRFTPSGREVWRYDDIYGIVYDVALNPSGSVYIAIGKPSYDYGRIWKFTKFGDIEWKFSEFNQDVRCVEVDEDGFVYGGGFDGTLRKISSDGEEVWRFSGFNDPGFVNDVEIGPGGFIYARSRDEKIRKISPDGEEIWNRGDSDLFGALTVGKDRSVYASWDTYTDTSGDTDVYKGRIKKFTAGGQEVWSSSFISGGVVIHDIVLGRDGYLYASGNEKLFKLTTGGEKIWGINVSGGLVEGIDIGPNGFIYAAPEEGTISKFTPDGYLVWKNDEINNFVESVAAGTFSRYIGPNTQEDSELYYSETDPIENRIRD